MKVISIEDARRVFIATVSLIHQNNKEGYPTYRLTRNMDRINLPNNSGDVINIPSQKFKKALGIVLGRFGLHQEQKTAFINTFVELHWIMRPKDKTSRRYKKTVTSRCDIGGKDTAVYRVDRIIFDFLGSMDGVKAMDLSNNIIHVPQRTPDGDIRVENDNTVKTTVTTGQVCDEKYEQFLMVMKEMRKRGHQG